MHSFQLNDYSQEPIFQPIQLKTPWSLIPEYDQQVAVMVAWPHKNTLWANKLEEARLNFSDLISAISMATTPWVLVPNEAAKAEVESYVQASLKKYNRQPKFKTEYSVCEYDDTWIRDYGPLTAFKKSDQSGKIHLMLQNFYFNGWGHKYKCDLDNLVNETLWNNGEFERIYLSKLDMKNLSSIQTQSLPFVLEGGSIDTNGDILMTTSNCLLNVNRNAVISQLGIEHTLKNELGGRHILWLSNGHLEGDDTDSHVDTLARFINQNTIVFQGCDDESDSHYHNLQAMKQELLVASEQYNLKIIELPWPKAVFDDKGRRLPATYANFLIVNSYLLLPTYNCSTDTLAIQTIQENCPEMIVVGVPCLTLIKHNGSLHCSTMQLPQIRGSL